MGTHRTLDETIGRLYDKLNTKVPWSVVITLSLVAVSGIVGSYLLMQRGVDEANAYVVQLKVEQASLVAEIKSLTKSVDSLDGTIKKLNTSGGSVKLSAPPSGGEPGNS